MRVWTDSVCGMEIKMAELLFLGTGAADWKLEEKDGFFRRNSAALIDRTLMLDCGSHIFDYAEASGDTALYSGVTDVIITHNHFDHFCRDSVLRLAQNQKIRVGCSGEIMNIIGGNPNIEFVVFTPFEEQNMGKYKIIPLLANHSVIYSGDACAFHYIIETPDAKKIFYGLDGAWFLRPSWEVMKLHRFDVMVLDCTVGDSDDWRMFEHNTIPMLRAMINEIRNRNMLAEHGKIIASHMAKALHVSHEDTAEILKRIDVLTAYDGMKITV